MQSEAPANWITRYLSLLDLEREPPTLEYLRRLTRAHLSRVPFENVTSILRRASAGDQPVPRLDRDAELEAWLDQRGGGLCFEVVEMFGALLAALGFRTHPVLATISFVGSHQGIIVTIDGVDYMVDVGNGAPFFDPVPLSESGDAVEISQVGLAYRFRPAPDRPAAWIQDRLIEDQWQPFCTYDLAPAADADRASAFQRHHMRGRSWVVDNLTLIRCTESDVWSLRDHRLTHFDATGKDVREIGSDEEYRGVAAELFNLPKAPIEAAVHVLYR